MIQGRQSHQAKRPKAMRYPKTFPSPSYPFVLFNLQACHLGAVPKEGTIVPGLGQGISY